MATKKPASAKHLTEVVTYKSPMFGNMFEVRCPCGYMMRSQNQEYAGELMIAHEENPDYKYPSVVHEEIKKNKPVK